MATISISRNHTLPLETLRERVAPMQEKLRTKYKTESSWDNDSTLSVKGPGVKGKLVFTSEHVSVELELGLMLRPMKGKIEETITRELDRIVV